MRELFSKDTPRRFGNLRAFTHYETWINAYARDKLVDQFPQTDGQYILRVGFNYNVGAFSYVPT